MDDITIEQAATPRERYEARDLQLV